MLVYLRDGERKRGRRERGGTEGGQRGYEQEDGVDEEHTNIKREKGEEKKKKNTEHT